MTRPDTTQAASPQARTLQALRHRWSILALFALAAAATLATPPKAQAEVPSRVKLQVVNVASDDVLNLREAPNARSPIVGEMPPGSSQAITVGPSQGDWLYVRHDWMEGWARARYLIAIEPGVGLSADQPGALRGLVIGIRSGRSLAVHADPSAQSAVVARLPAGSKEALVTGLEQNGWRHVQAAGRSGWVPARNLLPATAQDDHGLAWHCSGTEPFWGLRLIQDKLRYTNLDGNDVSSLGSLTELPGLADGEPGATKLLTSRGGHLSARIEAMSQRGDQACSDGMSDADYPFYIRALIGQHNFEGCCSLSAY